MAVMPPVEVRVFVEIDRDAEERIREIVREEIGATHPDDVVERLAGALIKGLER